MWKTDRAERDFYDAIGAMLQDPEWSATHLQLSCKQEQQWLDDGGALAPEGDDDE